MSKNSDKKFMIQTNRNDVSKKKNASPSKHPPARIPQHASPSKLTDSLGYVGLEECIGLKFLSKDVSQCVRNLLYVEILQQDPPASFTHSDMLVLKNASAGNSYQKT